MPKHIIQQADVVMREALALYQQRDMTTEQIAQLKEISTATLTVWAKKAGLPLRNRGRRRQERPTPMQLQIVKMASVYNYDEVGREFGMHKQSIHRIVKRWRSWAEPRHAPFSPGDMLLWRGKKLTVVDANHHDGTLVDERGKLYKNFSWNGGRIPQKIGVNSRYVVADANAA
jgi:transposase